MKIYITRHGKTVWNQERKLQGCQDSPLVEQGIENALALRKKVSAMHFDAIYASPIKRAYDTAKLVFPKENIIKDERIREMNFGLAEGKYIDHMPANLKDAYTKLWNEPDAIEGMPEGESYTSIIERVNDFFNDITHKNYDSVFIVTHGFCFTVFMACMLHLSRHDFVKVNRQVVDGCSLTIVDYDGDYHIETLGENDYLPYQSNESYTK